MLAVWLDDYDALGKGLMGKGTSIPKMLCKTISRLSYGGVCRSSVLSFMDHQPPLLLNKAEVPPGTFVDDPQEDRIMMCAAERTTLLTQLCVQERSVRYSQRRSAGNDDGSLPQFLERLLQGPMNVLVLWETSSM